MDKASNHVSLRFNQTEPYKKLTQNYMEKGT